MRPHRTPGCGQARLAPAPPGVGNDRNGGAQCQVSYVDRSQSCRCCRCRSRLSSSPEERRQRPRPSAPSRRPAPSSRPAWGRSRRPLPGQPPPAAPRPAASLLTGPFRTPSTAGLPASSPAAAAAAKNAATAKKLAAAAAATDGPHAMPCRSSSSDRRRSHAAHGQLPAAGPGLRPHQHVGRRRDRRERPERGRQRHAEHQLSSRRTSNPRTRACAPVTGTWSRPTTSARSWCSTSACSACQRRSRSTPSWDSPARDTAAAETSRACTTPATAGTGSSPRSCRRTPKPAAGLLPAASRASGQ